jgi:formate dehydrogenase major subunit
MFEEQAPRTAMHAKGTAAMSGTERRSENTAAQQFRTLAQQSEKQPPCQANCPNSGDVRGWLGIIAQHEKNGLTRNQAFDQAWGKIAQLNPLPATIARICPHPCEDRCIRSDKDGAVSINALERFLGDWGLARKLPLPSVMQRRHEESIGVIGSGPASLSFAYQMARRGYRVTVYERGESIGGMLRRAIPEYRLPHDVLEAEVERLLEIGITLENNTDIGSAIGFGELRDRHDLVFLGLGAQAARRLGIPGEDGPGVTAGIDYLRDRKRHGQSLEGQRVLVVGGGNTAIDSARSALRDGAEVTLLYRRSETEMPAIPAEVADARAEGVKFRFLVSPTRIVRDGDAITGVEIQAMRLGKPDEQGRRRPIPEKGPPQISAADQVIIAVSQAPDWHGLEAILDEGGSAHTDNDGRLTEGIWAGGDNRGSGIASNAVAQGRLAAESAHAELRGMPKPRAPEHDNTIRKTCVQHDYYAGRHRGERPRLPEEERLANPDAEIDKTIGAEEAYREAVRCMSCGLCFDCQQCFMYCNAAGFTRVAETRPGNYFVLALEACEGCGKCVELCPCGYLELRDTESAPLMNSDI